MFSDFIVNAVVAASLLLAACTAQALYIKEVSLDERVSESDMVIVGKVIKIDKTIMQKTYDTAVVEVSRILKGRPSKRIGLSFNGMHSEANPDCCVVGRIYVIFLKNSAQDEYFSVNSPYGIYSVE